MTNGTILSLRLLLSDLLDKADYKWLVLSYLDLQNQRHHLVLPSTFPNRVSKHVSISQQFQNVFKAVLDSLVCLRIVINYTL